MKCIARLIASILLLLLLAACDKTPPPPMVFGSGVWPGYEPVYLAGEQGYFSAVNLRLAEYANATEVKQAFIKHEVHVAAVTMIEALQLRREIPDLKIVFLFDSSNGVDVILAQPGIADLAQLQGHRIGVENSLRATYFLNLALRSAGMQSNQVKRVILPQAEQAAAFRAHKVDALVSTEPVSSALQEAGALALFDSSGVAGKLFDVLVVRDDDIGRFHREIMELLQGWQRALEYIQAQPEKSMQAMAAREKITPAQFAKVMQGIKLLGLARNRELLIGEPPVVAGSVDVMQRYLMERGLINMGADTSTLLAVGLLAGGK